MRKALLPAVLLAPLIIVPVVIKVTRTAEPKSVDIEHAQLRLLAPTIFASGTLAYSQEVRLVPEVIGRVVEIRVKEGDRVKKGDLLLRLDPTRGDLSKTEIRAPISGMVTVVIIKVGETAVPSATSIAGSDLMVIAQTDERYAEINVDETDIAQIVLQQSAKVVPAALPDESWPGEVTWISIAATRNSGHNKTYTVRIRLDAEVADKFRPGMSCRAEILTRRADAHSTLSVPLEAVRYEEIANRSLTTQASLFVIHDGVAHMREVETGAADDTYIEILRGLKANEPVVVGPSRQLRFLRDGDRVRSQ
jgi:HlyD family secretion protein